MVKSVTSRPKEGGGSKEIRRASPAGCSGGGGGIYEGLRVPGFGIVSLGQGPCGGEIERREGWKKDPAEEDKQIAGQGPCGGGIAGQSSSGGWRRLWRERGKGERARGG